MCARHACAPPRLTCCSAVRTRHCWHYAARDDWWRRRHLCCWRWRGLGHSQRRCSVWHNRRCRRAGRTKAQQREHGRACVGACVRASVHMPISSVTAGVPMHGEHVEGEGGMVAQCPRCTAKCLAERRKHLGLHSVRGPHPGRSTPWRPPCAPPLPRPASPARYTHARTHTCTHAHTHACTHTRTHAHSARRASS